MEDAWDKQEVIWDLSHFLGLADVMPGDE